MGLCAAEDTGINNVGLLYSKTASVEKKGEGVENPTLYSRERQEWKRRV